MLQSRTRKLFAVLGAAVVAVFIAVPVASAQEPAEGFEQFAGCPTPEEANLFFCIRSDVDSGHLNMGSKEVPIQEPLTIVGGLDEEFENFTAGPGGGLSVVKQQVPGGIIGLTGLDWLVNFLNIKELQLFAAAELAGPPTNFSIATVTFPLKFHLINPILGDDCYVGSNEDPIELKLTTGTTNPPPPNEPISGTFPTTKEDAEKQIIFLEDGTYVDNAFSAPGANGCQLTLFGFIPIDLDGLVNHQSGLPSAAGTNEAVQNFDIELTVQSAVYP